MPEYKCPSHYENGRATYLKKRETDSRTLFINSYVIDFKGSWEVGIIKPLSTTPVATNSLSATKEKKLNNFLNYIPHLLRRSQKNQMTKNIFKSLLANQIDRIERKSVELKSRSGLVSKIRIFVFIGCILFSYLGYGMIPDSFYLIILLIWVVVFLFFVDRHQKIEHTLEKFLHLKSTKEEHLARIDLIWEGIPYRDIGKSLAGHHFEDDLNIIGEKSIHHLLDNCIYEGSSKRLADWLLTENPDKEIITERQKLVSELAPLQLFRDRLRVTAKFTKQNTSKKDWSMEELLVWLQSPKKQGFMMPLIVLSILSVSNIMLGILALIGNVPLLVFLVSLSIYIVFYKFNDTKILGLFGGAFQLEKLMKPFGLILTRVESFKFRKGSSLELLVKPFQKEEDKPSKFLKKVASISAKAALQMNQVLWPLVNVTIPWDVYYAMKLEQLKAELAPNLEEWLDSFYELEALNSLASFAMLNPEYNFPTFEESSETFLEAKELGHPLISPSIKVENDFSVKKGQDLFLITGSNMAGKSTFLRTVGVNLILAYSGAPVNARHMNTEIFRVFTSINVTDSLGDGLSHFYAEVKRLRQLLDELEKSVERPLFFFVDEIYRGTNNRERFAGSAAFLREVARKTGIGMVSTHDLELSSLEEEIPQLSNWHFSESIEGGKMTFEYKMKPGPCPSTNALHIMKIEGLPV